MSETLAS
ncbi:hypothetical protein F383_27439 [Gossypium arboreum]|nr:hypothetical protein F383_27439 [Gossypium arboreum]